MGNDMLAPFWLDRLVTVLKRTFNWAAPKIGGTPRLAHTSEKMEIQEIIERAVVFRSMLAEVKQRIRPRDFKWYPYDSFSNLFPLKDLLRGEHRFLLDLIGNDPVLDVGCGDGVLSFFLESLGCKVHAIDNPPTNANQMKGVRALKAALGSSIEICEMDLDT